MGLTGDQGAKGLLKKYSEDLATVDFPDGYIDIDTQEDYENLLKGNPKP
jgi:molybdenum cofactor cytidylyltransferase